MKKLLPFLLLHLFVQSHAAERPETALVGDINHDGKVSVADIVEFINIKGAGNQYYWTAISAGQVGWANTNFNQKQDIYCADVNLDGIIDDSDLEWLVDIILGDGIGDIEIEADNQDLFCEFEDQQEEIPSWANGHGLVDMGITDDDGNTIYWATCNVGAMSPDECGDYFAWGEISKKNYYHWYYQEQYKWGTSEDRLTKYNATDKKTELEPADDAAHQNWEGPWRMPTKAEMQQLTENCIWVWSKLNDAWGYTVISKNTQNYIFLPSGGYRYMDGYTKKDLHYGYYWTKTIGEESYAGANSLVFSQRKYETSQTNAISVHQTQRNFGLNIRPVCVCPSR